MARYAIIGTRKPDTDQIWCAERLAKVKSVVLYHPYPSGLNAVGYQLHARNYGILAYPEHVGTGQGIRIAKALNIPCYILPKDAGFSVLPFKLSIAEFLNAI